MEKNQDNYKEKINYFFYATAAFLFLTCTLVYYYEFLLVVFASVVWALLLCTVAQYIERKTPLSFRVSVILTLTALILITIVSLSLFWPQFQPQFIELKNSFPERLQIAVKSLTEKMPLSDSIENSLKNPGEWISHHSTQVLGSASKVLGSIFGSLSAFLLVFIVGFYMALDPKVYKKGFLKIFAKSDREAVGEFLEDISAKLKWWILGRIITMGVVAIGVYIGLLISNVPIAFAFSVISGLLVFIPFIGPTISFIFPAVFAFGLPEVSIWGVVITFSVVQFLEGYLLTPIIEKRTVYLPPALTIVMVTILSIVAGIPGAMFAAPLTVVAMTAFSRFRA